MQDIETLASKSPPADSPPPNAAETALVTEQRSNRFSLAVLIAVGLAFGLVVSACGSGSTSPSVAEGSDGDQIALTALDVEQVAGAVVANSAGTVTTTGRQRVMTAILGSDTRPFLGGPEIPVTIAFEAVDDEGSGQVEGTWLTTNAAALGLYVSYFEFPSAGQWEVIVSTAGSEVTRTMMIVTEESPNPNVGDSAPPTDSPTGSTPAEIAAISTDLDPNPSFYELSIADAIGNGRPTVVTFVTPAFCQTALCGPTLEAVKGATAGRDGIDVVHVEPFDLELAAAGDLQPVPAMVDWGLQTEPWVFIIDSDGTVSATFEGIIGQDELAVALEGL